MKNKKTLCAALAVMLTLTTGVFTGCNKNSAKDNSNENVKLKWVMLGPGKQKDADMVWNKFNEQLKEYVPNTEVEFEIIEGSAFGEKWQLMSAASEQIDIAWTGYAISSFIGEVEKGAYLPLDNLIDENAPDLKKELPDWIFELGKVNNEIYAIPNYQMMATSPYGIHIRKEHEKYMDIEAIQAKYNEWATNPEAGKEVYQLFADYFQKMKDNGKIGNGVGLGSFKGLTKKQTYDGTTVPGFVIDTDTMTVEYEDMSDYKKLWYDTVADWYKKGYVRNDILSENMDGVDEAEKGYILWAHGYFNDTSEKTESLSKGFECRVFGLGEKYYIKNTVPATMTTIGRTSVNPARAIKVIDLMNTKKGKDLYNLLSFGIEDVHYKKVSDNRIEPIDYVSQGDSNSKYGLFKWAVGNTANSFELSSDEEGMAEYIRSIDENAEILPCVGFKPDTSGLTVELAQISSVKKEFETLNFGAHSNYEEIYEEYMSKLKSAGVEKVIDELQKQLDEWLKTHK